MAQYFEDWASFSPGAMSPSWPAFTALTRTIVEGSFPNTSGKALEIPTGQNNRVTCPAIDESGVTEVAALLWTDASFGSGMAGPGVVLRGSGTTAANSSGASVSFGRMSGYPAPYQARPARRITGSNTYSEGSQVLEADTWYWFVLRSISSSLVVAEIYTTNDTATPIYTQNLPDCSSISGTAIGLWLGPTPALVRCAKFAVGTDGDPAPFRSSGGDVVVAPGASHVIVQGHAPIVIRGDAQAVAPAVAHILVRGRAPTIHQPRTVVPKTAHAVITGRSPIVVQGDAQAIAPGVAHVVLQGRAPAIQQPRSVAPGAAPIAARGHAPAVIQGDAQAVAPGAGHVAVAGRAPQVHQPRGIAPGVAHVAVSGHAPVIDQIANIRPRTGHALAQGHIPAISQPQTIEPGAAHVVIAGHAPIIVRGLQIRPGAGRILVSGHAPAVEQGGARELQPGTARVMYRGYAPLITGAQAAPPPAHRIYRVPGPLRLFTVPTVEVPCS